MAFRINFPTLDHMVLRVARPNELNKWLEAFEKVLSSFVFLWLFPPFTLILHFILILFAYAYILYRKATLGDR